MKTILVFEDISGSMKILGKPVIQNSIHKTIEMVPEIYPEYADCKFEFKNWNGSLEEISGMLKKTTDPFIIISDGFLKNGGIKDLSNSSLKGAVIFVGSDSLFQKEISKSIKTFKSLDILEAINYVCK